MTIEQLYQIASERGVKIYDAPMRGLAAVSFPQGWIAIDRRQFPTDAEYKCALAHELAHILTGSFYKLNSRERVRDLNEYYANRCAAEMLVPLAELRRAMHRGILYGHILARMFDVTRDFMDMALEIHESELSAAARAWCAARIRRFA